MAFRDLVSYAELVGWKTMKNWIDKFLYIKLCWNTIVGYLGMPITILDKALLVGVFLKVFGVTQYKVVLVFGLVFVVNLIYIGHRLLKGGILERDISISNRFNPELQEIYRKAGGIAPSPIFKAKGGIIESTEDNLVSFEAIEENDKKGEPTPIDHIL